MITNTLIIMTNVAIIIITTITLTHMNVNNIANIINTNITRVTLVNTFITIHCYLIEFAFDIIHQ